MARTSIATFSPLGLSVADLGQLPVNTLIHVNGGYFNEDFRFLT